jgi:Ca2+ transporting ATPase
MMGQNFLPEFKDEYDSLIGTDLGAKYHDGLLEGTMTSGLYYPLSGTYSYEPYFKKYQVYSRHFTFIFNAFVMMQVFNFFNCRKIRDEINIFTGLFKNYIFFLILGFVVIFQFVIIFFLNKFFNCYRYHGLTLIQWLWCIFIGFSVIPVSIILRFIPYGK